MEYFVDKNSIVRQIWGKSDTILFIFAGASAEFALNKAVDWLYFTGRLPSDPLGRLFSTVSYARAIVFSENEAALRAIDAMAHIHAKVESSRSSTIPDWAYRDVLFMLIDYSIRSFEVLEHNLSGTEKEEVFDVFKRMGNRMGLKELPDNSVHLMITSPPYNVSKEYDDDLTLQQYLILLENSFKETYRVLVHGGRACINVANLGRKPYIPLSDYISKIMIEIGFKMRGEIIWNKEQANIPANYKWYDKASIKKDFSIYTKWTQQLNANFQTFVDIQFRNVLYKNDGYRNNPSLAVYSNNSFFNPKFGVTYSKKI